MCSLDAPFTPEKYIEAIRAAESAGYDTIIIDSLSHAWAGPGGVLDIQGHVADKSGNSWTAWRQVTPRHNDLVDAILLSRCHIIATMRSKMDHIQTVENGKTVIKKVGMNPIQRDGMEYEFPLFIDLDLTHTASASKDRTTLFDGQVFKPTPDVGKKLKAWLESGADNAAHEQKATQFTGAAGGQADRAEQVPLTAQSRQAQGKKVAKSRPAGDDWTGDWPEDWPQATSPGTATGQVDSGSRQDRSGINRPMPLALRTKAALERLDHSPPLDRKLRQTGPRHRPGWQRRQGQSNRLAMVMGVEGGACFEQENGHAF